MALMIGAGVPPTETIMALMPDGSSLFNDFLSFRF
jgi:hypothetical protein